MPSSRRILTYSIASSQDYALVPLNAAPIGKFDSDEINITEQYPPTAEHAQVDFDSGWTETNIDPNVSFSAGPVGAQLSGVGRRKHRVTEKPFTISLEPMVDVIDGQPTYLSW